MFIRAGSSPVTRNKEQRHYVPLFFILGDGIAETARVARFTVVLERKTATRALRSAKCVVRPSPAAKKRHKVPLLFYVRSLVGHDCLKVSFDDGIGKFSLVTFREVVRRKYERDVELNGIRAAVQSIINRVEIVIIHREVFAEIV